MSKRLMLFVLTGLVVLLSLTLAACEKERPVPTPAGRATVAPARSTVGPTAAAPAATRTAPEQPATSGQITPTAVGTASTPATSQPTAVSPAATSSAGSVSSPSGAGKYVIQAGDTLAAIARRFGTTIAELQRLNNITDPDLVIVGQTLIVPGSGEGTATTTTTEEGETYVVQAGDTLGTIATEFGVTVQQLQAANNITDPNLISVGQELVIP